MSEEGGEMHKSKYPVGTIKATYRRTWVDNFKIILYLKKQEEYLARVRREHEKLLLFTEGQMTEQSFSALVDKYPTRCEMDLATGPHPIEYIEPPPNLK
jgi:hypothetical protein